VLILTMLVVTAVGFVVGVWGLVALEARAHDRSSPPSKTEPEPEPKPQRCELHAPPIHSEADLEADTIDVLMERARAVEAAGKQSAKDGYEYSARQWFKQADAYRAEARRLLQDKPKPGKLVLLRGGPEPCYRKNEPKE
jgi:hypothetical protein